MKSLEELEPVGAANSDGQNSESLYSSYEPGLAAAEYKKSEEKLRKIFMAVEHSPHSIVVTDPEGKIEYVNPRFTEMTGCTFEEVRGFTPGILKSGHTAPEVYLDLWKTIKSGKKWHGNLLNKKKSGELYWESVSISPVIGEDGSITQFIALKEDITEKIQLEELLHKLNRTLNALRHCTDVIIRAADEKSFLEEVCKIITNDCGYALVWIGFVEHDIEKSVRPVASYGFEEGYLQTLKVSWADNDRGRGPSGTAIRTGEVCYCRNMQTDPRFLPWRHEAAKRGYASSVALPLKTDENPFGVITIYDRTPGHFSDEEVKLLSELADNLAYGISSLRIREAHKAALEKERELNELKSKFISTTSHEFRTPLTSLLSSMQLIQRYRKKWSDERVEEEFQIVKNSVFNLTRLLDDILTISYADSGKIIFNPKQFDLNVLCLEIIEEVKHLAGKKHKLNFEFSSNEKVFFLDPKLIRFIIVNLLSNAFKYSPDGGRVELKVSSTNSCIEISVSDKGIGISVEEMEQLFRPFFRGANTSDIQGTGLGLSIVQRAVDLHNGSISCTSKPSNGTIFTVKIPRGTNGKMYSDN